MSRRRRSNSVAKESTATPVGESMNAASAVLEAAPAPNESHVRRTLNFRFLLTSLAVAIGMAAVLFVVHRVQTQRSAVALLNRGQQLITEKQPKEAITYLQRYLGIVPDDIQARLLYCETLGQTARTAREQLTLFLALHDLLRRAPEFDVQRRKLCAVALRIGRFKDARYHIELLLKSVPQDGELLFQLGRCDEADERFSAAAKDYQSAISNGWREPEVYYRLASILKLKLEQAKTANQQLDLMITANPRSALAYLIRSRWRIVEGDLPGARSDIQQAQQLGPQDVDVHLVAAELIRINPQADPQQANAIRGKLTELVKLHVRDARLYVMLAVLSQAEKGASENWLRRGVTAIPTDFDLRMRLVELLIEEERYDAAREQMEQLSLAATTQPIIEGVRNMLEATILMRQESWAEARERLLNAQNQLISRPDLLERTTKLLADCFRQLHDRVSEIEAYRVILKANPLDQFARSRLAQALAANGQADDALEDLKKLKDAAGQVQLLYQQQMRLPPNKRRWDDLLKFTNEARSAAPDNAQLTILMALIQAAQGQLEDARQTLADARAKYPREISYWVAASELAQSRKDWKVAEETLQAATKELGDKPELQAAWSMYWANRGGDQAPPELEKIEQGLERFQPLEQTAVLGALVNAHRRLNRLPDALRLASRVAKLKPNDLDVQLRFFGAAFESNHPEQMRRATAAIRRIEGRNGIYAALAQAAELLRQAEQQPEKRQERLVEAQLLLSRVEKQRPDLPLVWLFKARIDEFDVIKNGDEAIANYRKALELNDQNPAILSRLVQLQRERQEWSEAQATIRTYSDMPGLWSSTEFCTLASEVALRTGDMNRARELALTAVRVDPQSGRSQAWLGTVLAESDKPEDATTAEAALRKAVEIEPELDAAWIVLIKLLTRQNREPDARAALETASRHLAAKSQSLALALCHEALGDITKANQLIEAGLQAAPREPNVLKSAILYFIRNNQHDQAEATIKTLLGPSVSALPSDRMAAQRLLTLVLARRNYRGFSESLAELEKQSTSSSREEIRSEQLFKARVLASWPFLKERKRAVQLLEDEIRRGPIPVVDAVLLAEQYDAIGEPAKSETQWQGLLASQPDNPFVLLSASRHFLRNQDWQQLQPILEKLKTLKPNDVATIQLMAQANVAQGRCADAVRIIDEFIADKSTEPPQKTRLTAAGAILDLLTTAPKLSEDDRHLLDIAAERIYRQLQASTPEATLGLASAIARLGRVDEALRLCEQAPAGLAPLAVSGRALAILNQAQPTPEQSQLIERLLAKSAQDPLNANAAAIQRADLRLLEQRYDEVIDIYRQILIDQPNQVVALNNLAWFLAAKKQQYVEAGQLVERAINVAGPQPTLIDTRGTIRLMEGRWNDALVDFSNSLREQDLPDVRFRLAAAMWNLNNRTEATEMVRKLIADGFDAQQKINPLERQAYAAFFTELVSSAK